MTTNESPKPQRKETEYIDPIRLGDLTCVKNGLEQNIPGKLINGNPLKKPVPLYESVKRSESVDDAEEPDINEMDILHQSFKPGLPLTQRYKMQDQSKFYRTQFPNSAYNTRINSFAARVASADPSNTKDTASAIRQMKKSSLQATCRDMKHEVTKAASMYNYNIKAKHMDTMSSFFASKNFELKTKKTSWSD